MKVKMKGQALLIMILVMTVAMTIGLAVISRSITNIKMSVEQEESARAFSVAEAGIEEALKAGFTTPQEVTLTVGGADVAAQVVPTDLGGQAEFIFPKEVEAGDTQTVWLIGHDSNGELDPDDEEQRFSGPLVRVYWGNEETPADQATTPALEMTFFYEDGGEFQTEKFTADPNTARRANNQFGNARTGGCTLGEQVLAFCQNFNLQSGPGVIPYALRLKLLYGNESHLLGVEGVGDDLPLQGRCYRSCASLATSGVARCVRHCQFLASPLGIFDYALYSEGDLVKTP